METETLSGRMPAAASLPLQLGWRQQERLTSKEAAEYLQVKQGTVQEWARRGKLKGYQLSGTVRHIWRFRKGDLDAITKPGARGTGSSLGEARSWDSSSEMSQAKAKRCSGDFAILVWTQSFMNLI